MARIVPIAVCLVLLVAAIFGRTAGHEFIGYDDPLYILDNPHVSAGLTFGNIGWAFTSTHAANWHPVTWVSHMIDVSFFGMNPRGHHLVNVVWHAANAILLFLVLQGMTGALWRSALVAMLFAAHPLRVESVAWVSERKDVLSTFLGLLVVWLHLRRARRHRDSRAVLIPVVYAVGLMAKPMLVTLPALLLLFDIWPLGRWRPGKAPSPWRPLIIEKIPLVLLSIASGIVTYWAQQQGGMTKSLVRYPIVVRVTNALTSYVIYLWKTAFPQNLAMPYTHPGVAQPMLLTFGAALLLTGITVLAVRALRLRPYVAVGWFWYLVMLLPVIGLVQVGDQGLADRYTYLSVVGIFVALVWWAGGCADRHHRVRPAVALAAAVLVAALSAAAWRQAGHWRDSFTLMEHALEATEENWMLENNLGYALAKAGRYEPAERHLREALRIKPGLAEAHYNLACLLTLQGRNEEAVSHYRAALSRRSNAGNAHRGLAIVLGRLGDADGSRFHYRQAILLGERSGFEQSLPLKAPRAGR